MTNGEKYIESLSPDKIINMIGGYEALSGILKHSCDSCACCDYQYEDCGDCDCQDGIFSWLKKRSGYYERYYERDDGT